AGAVPGAIARLLAARQPGIGVSFDGVAETIGRRLLLALQLRPFDAEAAAALAEPVWASARAFACSESRRSGSTRFAALLGWLDPERAAAVVAAWPETPAPKLLDDSTRARLSLAKVLGMPAHRRLAEVLKDELYLWPIDEEDL
ncbi:MAG TPA: hypothetical protein VF384_10080, partial [Planctomycetota bacterium]